MILWRKSEFPDNHVHSRFLQSLTKNKNVHRPSLRGLVITAACIGSQVSLVFVFGAVFVFLYTDRLDPHTLVGLIAITCLPFCKRPRDIEETAKRGILFLVLYALSPILHTLSTDISTDSVWACSALMFTGHLFFCDYTWHTKAEYVPSLSTNLAMIASVLMASRLVVYTRVFALLVTSVLFFAVAPVLRRNILAKNPGYGVVGYNLFLGIVGIIMLHEWPVAVGGYLFLQIFVFAVGTCGFLAAHNHRSRPNGPWDHALAE